MLKAPAKTIRIKKVAIGFIIMELTMIAGRGFKGKSIQFSFFSSLDSFVEWYSLISILLLIVLS
jgi:hypothetical protein